MAVSLDATIGGAAANSYATVDEADAYFATRLYADAWTGLTGLAGAEKKAQGLIMGTGRLEVMPWDGTIAFLGQRLQHPRVGLLDRAGYAVLGTAILDDIKIALFEWTLFLLVTAKDPGATDPLANFSAIKVGSLSLSLRENAPRTAERIPQAVMQRILPYLIDDADFSRG